jgi:hypothetical protein
LHDVHIGGRCGSLSFLAVALVTDYITAEAILAVRTYAFLGKKKHIGIALVGMIVGEFAFLVFVAVKGVNQTALAIGTAGPCTASDKPGQHIVTGFWLCPVVFDLICTFATMYRV